MTTTAPETAPTHIPEPSSQPVAMPPQIIPRPAPPINTPRLFIRPLQEFDAADVHAIRGRYDVMKWSKSQTPDANLEATRKWIRDNFTDPILKPQFNFSVFEKDTVSYTTLPRVIGVFGVLFNGSNPAVGYIVHPDSWGKGYATEALNGLLDAWWALPLGMDDGASAEDGSKAGGDALFAETEKNNAPSLRVLHKCGFRPVDEFDDEGVQIVVLKLERPS